MASKTMISSTFKVPAALKNAVIAELSKVGTTNTTDNGDGTFTVVLSAEGVAKNLRSTIMAPVAVDGSGWKLMGRVDTGVAKKLDMGSNDPTEILLNELVDDGETMYGGLKWELFEHMTVTDDLRTAILEGDCPICNEKRNDQRRWFWITQTPAGEFKPVGTTCGAHKFGANLDEIFKSAIKDVPKKVRDIMRDCSVKVTATINYWEGQQDLEKTFGLSPLSLFEELLANAPSNTFYLNTVETLRAWKKGQIMAGWLVRKIKDEIAADARRKAAALNPQPVVEEAGEALEFQVKVISQKYEQGQYGGYYKTMAERLDGSKVWFRYNYSLHMDGRLYNVTGTFSGTGTNITFLKGRISCKQAK